MRCDNCSRDYALPSGHEVIVGGGWGLMRGIRIPQQDFVLKRQGGGGCICRTLWYMKAFECLANQFAL